MRLTPLKARGTSALCTVGVRSTRVARGPSLHDAVRPILWHISRVTAVSPIRGTLCRTTASSVSRLATICFVAAFFAPLIVTLPRSGVPPSIS